MTDPILNHPNILQVLFHPRGDYGTIRPDTHVVTVKVDKGVTLGGRLYPAEPDSPLILYYHGNGEIAADYDDLSVLYTQPGISLLVMDYRGYGTSSGTPTAKSLLTDAVAVFDQRARIFADYDLTPARVYVMGRSLGSVTAIETALHAGADLDGLIIESGFSDTFGLLRRMGVQVQGAEEQVQGFDSGQKMERITTRTLIIHGTHDVLIPPTDGQELYRRCAAAEKYLELIQGAGHNDIMLVGMQQYFEAVRRFVYPATEESKQRYES